MHVSLTRTRDSALSNIGKIQRVYDQFPDLPLETRYLLSEILLIRLSSVLEIFFSEAAYKLACGAAYLDGSAPALLINCKSMQSARNNMLKHGRPKPRSFLKWTAAPAIKDSVEKVIDPTDHYVITVYNHSARIKELFKVRNFAAHRSTSSREGYQDAVRTVYGRKRNIPIGVFLISNAHLTINNLQRYLVESRVIIRELCKS